MIAEKILNGITPEKNDLLKEAKKLLDGLGNGTVSASAYDTAWVARIPSEKNLAIPMFPETMKWLLKNQLSDGSWGGKIEYYHDRIICTLSAIIALDRYNKDKKFQAQIKKGKRYIESNICNLKKDLFETIGFELLLFPLINDAKSLSLNLSGKKEAIDKYRRMYDEKLKIFAQKDIYSTPTTILHSLESLESKLDIKKIKKLQSINGSFGNSPSSTAYFFSKNKDKEARKYILEVFKIFNSLYPSIYPFEIFEKSWILYNFLLAGLNVNKKKSKAVSHLKNNWNNEKGISISDSFGITDLDTSSVVFKVLIQNGIRLDPLVFKYYERDNHFVCFHFERNPSISSHTHLLEALYGCTDYPGYNISIKKIINFLRAERKENAYWIDKWHISPFYPTASAIFALINVDNKLTKEAIDWILSTQNEDGSWGYYKIVTLEETAYCLQSLVLYSSKVSSLDREPMRKAYEYLSRNYCDENYPEMWIDKCLYAPKNVIKSAIISALRMFEINYLK